VIEVRGERFEQGDEFVQITRRPDGRHPTTFAIDRLEGLREVAMTCQDTGAFSRWRLTAAGGGTFVEVEMGMLPETLTDRIFDRAVGRIYFRRWADQSLDALEAAAGPGAARGAE